MLAKGETLILQVSPYDGGVEIWIDLAIDAEGIANNFFGGSAHFTLDDERKTAALSYYRYACFPEGYNSYSSSVKYDANNALIAMVSKDHGIDEFTHAFPSDPSILVEAGKLYRYWTDDSGVRHAEKADDWADAGILPPFPASFFIDEYHVTGPKSGLTLDDDGVYRLYKNGELDTSTFGVVDFNGGRFFVANGQIVPNSGLVSDGAAWFYLANGQVVDYTGLALYDGEWFYVANGVLDTTKAGLVSYDGRDFMVAAGRILTEANGLIQDPASGNWYYVAGGQVADYRGLVLYDGVWCYIWDGKFLSDAEGYVEHNGATFYVVNGQVAP